MSGVGIVGLWRGHLPPSLVWGRGIHPLLRPVLGPRAAGEQSFKFRATEEFAVIIYVYKPIENC